MSERDVLNPQSMWDDDIQDNPCPDYGFDRARPDTLARAKAPGGTPFAREVTNTGHRLRLSWLNRSYPCAQRVLQFAAQFANSYFTVIDQDGGGRHYVGRFEGDMPRLQRGNLSYDLQDLNFVEYPGAPMLEYPSDWQRDGIFLDAIECTGQQNVATSGAWSQGAYDPDYVAPSSSSSGGSSAGSGSGTSNSPTAVLTAVTVYNPDSEGSGYEYQLTGITITQPGTGLTASDAAIGPNDLGEYVATPFTVDGNGSITGVTLPTRSDGSLERFPTATPAVNPYAYAPNSSSPNAPSTSTGSGSTSSSTGTVPPVAQNTGSSTGVGPDQVLLTMDDPGTAGDFATMEYRGYGVKLLLLCGPEYGQAQVYLDGVLQTITNPDGSTTQTIDCYAASEEGPQEVWVREDVSLGLHRVKVVVLGTKNAASSGTAIRFVRLAVMR